MQEKSESLKEEGVVLFGQKQYEQAMEKYEQAFELVESPELALYITSCFYYMKKYNETIASAAKYRKTYKETIKFHYFEGKSFEQLGQLSEAAATYFEALQVEVNQNIPSIDIFNRKTTHFLETIRQCDGKS